MLKGERVILRAVEREDLARLHELQRNLDLVLFGFGAWQPRALAAFERGFERHLDDEEPAWFAIEIDGTVVGDLSLHHRDRPNRNRRQRSKKPPQQRDRDDVLRDSTLVVNQNRGR